MKDLKVKLSALWAVVMFNMVFADIFSMTFSETANEPVVGPGGMEITPIFLLVAAILVEIPIVMIILSQVLKYKANRWVNIIASVLTILFVTGGGSTDIHYIFFAGVEVVCMLLIIWLAWNWREQAA
jgi:hypothetical protein